MKVKQLPQVDLIKSILSYNQETGLFTWSAKSSPLSRVAIGSIAGHVGADGYVHIRICGTLFRAHRLAWLYVYGEPPYDCIDHIDGDTSNNRIANLRSVDHAQNMQNQRLNKRNSCGLTGVSKNRGKYMAQIKCLNERKFLGRFDTPEDAHKAYLSAKHEMHSFGTI